MTRTNVTPLVDRMLGWSIDHPLSPLARYALAVLTIAIVALVRAMFVTELLPWLLFIPAILVIALMLGEGPAYAGAVLATLLAAVTIGHVDNPALLTGPQWTGSILFLLIALAIARLAGELRAAFRRWRTLNARLADRETFLSSVFASSTDCIKVLDLDGRVVFMSEGGQRVMEVDDFATIEGCPWPDFWTGSGQVEAVAAITAAREGRASHFIGKADTMLGTPKWWDVSVSAIPGPDGTPERILSVSRDNTALMASQERQELLNAELGHRLKNVLALVQSIANQTFRRTDDVTTANATFAARLSALGKATDVLTGKAWSAATLDEVARAGLTSVDGMRPRVRVDGPEILLSPQVALALTLALHELTTNACKYGALSNDSGTVDLQWAIGPGADADTDGPDRRFTLTWREAGGPPVTEPTRRGFGSTMIERSLSAYFRGKAVLAFEPDGLVFHIDAPAPGTILGD